MMNIKKVISIIMVFCVVFSSISIAVFSLSWDGSSAGGSTNAVNGSATGYVIRDTEDANCVVGYRFSSVTSSGAMKVTKVIDVYRNTGNGNNAYANSAKFSTKYNKKQLIANKNKKMTTTYNKTNCLKEKDVGFTTSLPNPNGVGAWQKYEANINKVLLKLGVGSVANMNYGDKVIIEPLFDICLAGEYQALTVSEISYCGRSVLGGGSVGGAPDNTSRTWGFIANYTNRIWPNKLYTPDGQGLWSGVGAIAGSSKATFDNILSKGYGAGIAYNEKTNSSYVINFNGNGATGGSTPSMSMTRGTAKNLTANGFTRTGYSFSSWNTKNNGTGTAYADKQSVKDLTSGTSITLYAIWKPITYSIVFDGNGNTGGSTASMSMTYDAAKNLTANGFVKTGYVFDGWNTKADGTGTNYTDKQSVKNLSSVNGTTVTLYAKWKPITYTIRFDGNGATSGATAQMSMTYDVAKNLTANGFSKSGSLFTGWNTKANDSGTGFYNKQSVKNLTAVNGAVVTLYAQWSTNSYTVAFVGNGNTGGNTSSMTMKFDETKALNKNGYVKTGYSFTKWNTKSNGTGTAYSNQQSVKNLTNVNGGIFFLYAQWTPNNYVIKFNGNGATSGSTASMNMTYDVAKNLTPNGFARTGYIFNGWNRFASGIGTSYSDKQSVKNLSSTNGATVNLYAKWKPITYTIKFDGNGATDGSTASMSMTYNVSKKLTANGFTRTSYKFIGWNTKSDGTGTNYTDKQSVKNLSTTNGATVTLYAKWQYDPILAVKECDVYSGAKNNKATLFGISTGNVFDDYEYKTNYPTIGSTVWYNVFFPSEAENIKVKQYVKYNSGSWNTRTVTLSGSNSSSQWFPVQFTGKYKTVKADTAYYEIQAKTDWVDSTGKVLKSGSVKTFYIPIKPVVYRSQVSASGYEGNTVAYNGLSGSGGKLYSGQHIRTAYKYTADNTWSAAEYLRGAMYYHNGSKWVNAYNSNGDFDAAKNKTGIEKSAPITLNSSIESYTVPKTTQNKLRFNLQTWWASDKDHTFEETWYDLPVVQSDVATSKIILIDSQTKVNLDPNNLEAGQSVLVRYTYKNNTDAKVYVEGFRDDKKQISGVYAIPAKSSITVDGYTFTVPNKRNISIWGGVYLEGMGIYNTSYETNGNNNAITLKCKVKHPLTLIPITPNADYRETTDVVTSFWLNNSYSDSYTPSENISVKFNVYKGSTVIKTVTKTQAVVPGNSSNLLYFKWKVPSGLNNADVKITGEIIDGGISYNRVSKEYSTIPKITSVTPDTRFEKKAPTGFSLKSSPTETSQSAAWWEWTYSSGKFTKKNYGIEYSNGNAAITPETGSTSAKINSVWHMKSGYGISLSVSNYASVLSGYTAPSGSAYTNSQFASAKFPEFEYSDARGKYKTLTLTGNSWIFPANGSYGNVHFTPIWYPNGNYTVSVTLSDLWTPAGMITKTVNTNTIKIIDSAYDDWHVGR